MSHFPLVFMRGDQCIITSPGIVVAKYYDECICVCICLCVCPTGYLWNHTWSLLNFLCMLPMSVAQSSSGTFKIGRVASHGKGFSSPLTVLYNALAAKGIIRSPCSTRNHSVAATFSENGIDWNIGRQCTARAKCNLWLPCLYLAHVLSLLCSKQVGQLTGRASNTDLQQKLIQSWNCKYNFFGVADCRWVHFVAQKVQCEVCVYIWPSCVRYLT